MDRVAIENSEQSCDGFSDAFQTMFGEPTGRDQNSPSVTVNWIRSPLGPLVVGATEAGVCLLEFSDRHTLANQFTTIERRCTAPIVPGTNDHLRVLEEQLDEYFAGTLREFTVPLAPSGTEFQQRVWSQLLKIPYGETRSYEDVAIAIGARGAQRAVGLANGQNRIAIVIPCHRVVNKGGKLGGYGGGLQRKEFLLELEKASVTKDTAASRQ